jgi:hypothetical protein
MKQLSVVIALLAAMFCESAAEAGIFGRRGGLTANQYRSYPQQPRPAYRASEYRSYSQQPTFPFSSRSDPRDWKEAHRGYGVKIRGW